MEANDARKSGPTRDASCDKQARRERTRIVVFISFIIVAFVGLGGRCYYLQCVAADHYSELSLDQRCSSLPLEAQRGPILDSRGRVLAASNQIRTVFAEPRAIAEPKETASQLAPILDMGAHEICRLITESRNPGYVALQVDATASRCDAARALYGIGVQSTWRRHYPIGQLASHVVGFTGRENKGLGGIEHRFDTELSGEGVRHAFNVDVHRRPLSYHVPQEGGVIATPTNGSAIILTLDAAIQQFAREELLKQYEKYSAESALAVVADAQTGAILAMVSLPDFDPTNVGRANPDHLLNHVLTDQFEPGSMIKPVVTAIAMDTGVVNKYETIFCEHGNYRGRGFGRIGEFDKGFGDLTVREILVNSSNVGMAKIGQRMGPERLYEGLTLFGFGRRIGFDLPGEAEGLLRHPSTWTGYSITRIPFGQEISVTALQMVRAYCMLANGGRLVRPYLVKALVQPDGSMVDIRPPALRVGYVIKPEISRWVVSEALASVVNEGTGKRAKLEKWQVFGKTGTAQIARSDGRGYEPRAYVTSFICGAPAEDPRVIVLVSVRRPDYAIEKRFTGGGTVASPVAARILERTMTYLEGTDPVKRTVARAAR